MRTDLWNLYKRWIDWVYKSTGYLMTIYLYAIYICCFLLAYVNRQTDPVLNTRNVIKITLKRGRPPIYRNYCEPVFNGW